MKKQIITAVILLLTVSAKAQMTLEHNYTSASDIDIIVGSNANNAPLQVIDLLLSGKKYALQDMVHSQVRIYNLDHSLWKTINLPSVTGGVPWTAYYISENLFKLDGLVDMAVTYSASPYTTLIINELGTILNTIDSCDLIQIYETGTDTFKAISQNLTNVGGYNAGSMQVYSLPGTIPCNICSSSNLGVGMPINNGAGGSLSDAIPNPNNGSFKIGYTLPDGVPRGEISFYNTNGQQEKSYNVYSNTRYLIIDNLQLPSGTYYYNLVANGMPTTAKKMIVIK